MRILSRESEGGRRIVPAAETPSPPPLAWRQQHHDGHGDDGELMMTKKEGGWVIVDSEGEGSMLEDVDYKHRIMQRFKIHARDFRILDPLLSYPSAILVRDSAIILNLEHIKAVITADEVLIRDPSDENVVPVVEELKRRLHDQNSKEIMDDDIDESAFELGALEVSLEAVCSFLDARTFELENAAYPTLDDLTHKVTARNLDQIRKLKSAMTRLTTRVQKPGRSDRRSQAFDRGRSVRGSQTSDRQFLTSRWATSEVVQHRHERMKEPP